jgi:hypothetical protein
MTYREKYPDVYKELDRIRNGPKPVLLTPGDILTLKLLRDYLREQLLGNWKTSERDHVLETLERILKQVG